MNNRSQALTLSAAFALFAGPASATDPRFGALPTGSISTSETHGVAAEICREHLFDPSAANIKLPVGYRLVTASEIAASNPRLVALFQANPRLRSYALGSLCFLSVHRLFIDGAAVHEGDAMPLAFWWANAEGPRHPDMRGKAGWLQVGSWYRSGTRDRPAILKTDPMAEFVDVQIHQLEPDRWRLRLVLANETVTAEVTTVGRPVPSRATQPGYMSVPMSGPAKDYFSVYTYFGHQHHAATGSWQATGTGVFSSALSIAGEAEAFDTVLQSGWASRTGLYRFSSQ